MAERTGARRKQTADVDALRIRQLAITARDGDPNATPTLEPTREAPEIGRRIARALDAEYRDQTSDDPSRAAAYANLLGLASAGAAIHARRLLREVQFKISRSGNVTRISGGYALPQALVTAADQADGAPSAASPGPETATTLYVELDIMTWAMLRALRGQLAARRDGLSAVVTVIDEILELEKQYPTLTVGAALEEAGLDRDTLSVDLDVALSALDADPDVGAHEISG